MKAKKMQQKLYIVIAVLMIICLSLTGLTFAWFTDKVTVDDFTLNFGKIELETSSTVTSKELPYTTADIKLTRGDQTLKEGSFAMPGDKVEINITVKLTENSQPAYYLVYFDGDDLFEYGSAFFFKSGADIYAVDGTVDNLTLSKVGSDGTLTEVTITEDTHIVGSIKKEDTAHEISFVQQIDKSATEDKFSGSRTFKCTIYAIQQANMTEKEAYKEMASKLTFVYELSEDGKYVYFGEYPQTLKANNVTIVSGPNASGYYTGSDGEKYVKQVVINNVDEDDIDDDAWQNILAQTKTADGTVMTVGQEYYFKVEKLKWRVLSNDGSGNLMIVCDTAVQAMAYQPNYKYEGECYYATDELGNILTDSSGNKIYANNYEYSALREFLNGTFYSQAFSNKQKRLINLTTVDNSAATTNDSTNQYACNNTQDYVFSLSYADVTNSAYGFDTTASNQDIARRFNTTDYTKATGALTVTKEYIEYYKNVTESDEEWSEYSPYLDSCAGVMLRSSHSLYNHIVCVVFFEHDVYFDFVGYSYCGSVPALQISLN